MQDGSSEVEGVSEGLVWFDSLSGAVRLHMASVAESVFLSFGR